MANPNGRKGSAFETAVVSYFVANGFPYCERRVKRGANDAGDIAGVPGFMGECKNEKRIDLAGYMKEVEVQKANAKAQVGAAIVKRRNHGVERSYVVMELKDFMELIK